MAKSKGADIGHLDRDAILEFIRTNPDKADKRSIARAFNIKGGGRVWLKTLLKQLERDGLVEAEKPRSRWQKTGLPAVLPLEVLAPDSDGDVICLPVERTFRGAPPRIFLAEGSLDAAPGAGDRVLAKIEPIEDGTFLARPFKALPRPRQDTIIGVVEAGNLIRPTDKRTKTDFMIREEDRGSVEPGQLVRAEITNSGRLDLPKARVVEVLGHEGDVGAISLISAAEHNLRLHFPDAAVEEAEAAQAVPDKGRKDYRDVPLVTIDGADARDFDDAVWAKRLPDDAGFRILVAIADVSHYVRPNSALDREAKKRGNSCYFPDRVLPMLPEALSNGWCSLVPHEDRGCLVADMTIDMQGKLIRKRFERGIMRSAARLTYERVEAALNGAPDDEIAPLVEPNLIPLRDAFTVLALAREQRGALDLDVPERFIELSEDRRHVVDIRPRERLTSHKIIEELMILANVAAAQVLEAIEHSVMYRVHDHPDPIKLEHLANLLEGTPVTLQRGVRLTAGKLNGILQSVAGEDYAPMINEAVLRAQAQAVYAPRNIGHFGLGLESYAHFTSPIRRYADLTVHRALIHAFGLGEGGEPLGASEAPIPLAEAISDCERQAAYAERSAKDRYLAAYHSGQIGQIFEARVSSVTKFGLFVELDRSGAHALVPMGLLPDDRYDFDAKTLRLEGRRWGRVFSSAQRLSVRLVEADGLTGSLVAEIVGEPEPSQFESLRLDSTPTLRKKGAKSLGKKGKKTQNRR
ncbi:MAG: ribonuclease R [Alphaproteobacteria bacterium]